MQNKGNWILAGVGVVALYLLMGYFSINSAQEDIAGRTGNVWNQIDSGAEKLAQLQSQVLFAYDDRQDLVDTIAASHNDILAAQEVGDMDAAMAAVGDANIAIDALAEAMPEYDLTPVQVSLMDETAGTFNRISYARDQLIDAQVSFNKTRLMWPMFASRVDVLGEGHNPADTTSIPNQFDNNGE
jgi:LemA protein